MKKDNPSIEKPSTETSQPSPEQRKNIAYENLMAADRDYQNAVKDLKKSEQAIRDVEQDLDQFRFELVKSVYEVALKAKTDPIKWLHYFVDSSKGEYSWETDVEPYLAMVEATIKDKTVT